MEIKRSEIIASVVIVAFMLIIGFIISEKIQRNLLEKYQVYDTASKINDKELFEYGMRTNVGNAFVYGELKTLDPVSYPGIQGQYSCIVKEEQIYTRHSRLVTEEYVDHNGETQTRTKIEYYWTWDTSSIEEKTATKISFLDIEFDYNKIPFANNKEIDIIGTGYHKREIYYATGTDFQGTIFTVLRNGTIDNTKFYKNHDIEQTIDSLEYGAELPLFWIVWIIITIMLVGIFYYLDNKWLD